MPKPLLIALTVVVTLLIVIGILRFLVNPLARNFKVYSLNQYLFLVGIVFMALRAVLPLLSLGIPPTLAVSSILWILICLVLLIADRLKLYRAEIICHTACSVWLLAQIPTDISRHGLNWSTGASVFVTLLCAVVFGTLLSHPFEVLRRAAKMRKRRE